MCVRALARRYRPSTLSIKPQPTNKPNTGGGARGGGPDGGGRGGGAGRAGAGGAGDEAHEGAAQRLVISGWVDFFFFFLGWGVVDVDFERGHVGCVRGGGRARRDLRTDDAAGV